MSSSIGPSGSRPTSTPTAGVRGGPLATPVQSTVPAATTPVAGNPHLSDFSQTDRLRTQIDQQARANPSFYGTLVGGVNSLLQRGGFGISPASQRSVMENLQGVSQGTMPQSTAHFRESQTFALDALSSYSQGRIIQGEMERFGATINLIGGVGMSAVEGIRSLFRSRPSTPPSNGGGGW
ncbi:hypothetical protein POL68_19710 [Stigmatella sp. ncwal1]|uniref:Uncharacterized protein n=1 Tax=Stigmatella ashevillensis TaxID=2995309 RepID=A0ABT5DC84_9BACT|nr:hypothetical protein [Stigmatella ashevillena]MDC0710713.1 hypothetical protein [Stigmatella ashevillena]